MRLTARFLLAFVVALALALGVTTWLNVRRESALFDRDVRGDSMIVGRLVAREYDLAMHAGDRPAAAEAIESANDIHVGFSIQRIALDHTPAEARARLEGGEPVAVRNDHAKPSGELVTYVPLRTPGAGVVRVTASLALEHRYVKATKRRSVLSSLAALGLAAAAVSVLGLLLIARPTRALIDKARRVGGGDFSGPLHFRQRDELGDLAIAINAMTDELAAAQVRAVRDNDARLAAVEQLRHADRLMTVGRLSAGIAHELGTPLNVIEGRAKMIQQGEVDGDEVTDSARIVVEQSRRITRIVRQLLDFSRRGERARHPVDVVALANQTERLLSSTARKADVELIAPTRTAPLAVLGDEGQLEQVITNLVVNAIHATPSGGRVAIEIREADGFGVIEVRDTGSGMDAETRERIFEPFFTTKDVGHGTGLGLSVVHGIVHDHRGHLEVESAPGQGSRFSVYVPVP